MFYFIMMIIIVLLLYYIIISTNIFFITFNYLNYMTEPGLFKTSINKYHC